MSEVPALETQNLLSDPTQLEYKPLVLDIVAGYGASKTGQTGRSIITEGGLNFPLGDIGRQWGKGIDLCVLQPVTEKGKDTLNKAIKIYERGVPAHLNGGVEISTRKYIPVTTLAVDSPPAAGGKRNKSKKPKRRNSRSKRRKTVSKRRR